MARGGTEFAFEGIQTPEENLAQRGVRIVAGVDEAGRGPLAGPVVAAAVIFDDKPPPGINDSKALSESKREALYDIILRQAHIGIGIVAPKDIDRLNIRGATLFAMRAAIGALAIEPQHVLIDGRDCPGSAFPETAIVKGDRHSLAIGAASIVAKVTRDRIMMALDKDYPAYGFAGHKGYPTKAHRDAVSIHGPSPHHRMSFAPVRAAAEKFQR